MLDGSDDHTTQFDKMPSRWPYEWQDEELNTKRNLHKVLLQFLDMPKILPPLTKLLPEPEKLQRGRTRAEDALTNSSVVVRGLKMPSPMDCVCPHRCFYDEN